MFCLQRILLHTNGKICQASGIGRREKWRRSTRQWRFRIVQGAQFALQQKQSHRGMGLSGLWPQNPGHLSLLHDDNFIFKSSICHLIPALLLLLLSAILFASFCHRQMRPACVTFILIFQRLQSSTSANWRIISGTNNI